MYAEPSLKGLPAQFHLEPAFFDARPRRQPDDVVGMITAKIAKTRSVREISEKLELGQRLTLPAQSTRIFDQIRDKFGLKVRPRRGSLGEFRDGNHSLIHEQRLLLAFWADPFCLKSRHDIDDLKLSPVSRMLRSEFAHAGQVLNLPELCVSEDWAG